LEDKRFGVEADAGILDVEAGALDVLAVYSGYYSV